MVSYSILLTVSTLLQLTNLIRFLQCVLFSQSFTDTKGEDRQSENEKKKRRREKKKKKKRKKKYKKKGYNKYQKISFIYFDPAV